MTYFCHHVDPFEKKASGHLSIVYNAPIGEAFARCNCCVHTIMDSLKRNKMANFINRLAESIFVGLLIEVIWHYLSKKLK